MWDETGMCPAASKAKRSADMYGSRRCTPGLRSWRSSSRAKGGHGLCQLAAQVGERNRRGCRPARLSRRSKGDCATRGLMRSRSVARVRAALAASDHKRVESSSRPEASTRAGGASVTRESSTSPLRDSSTSSVGPRPTVACAAALPCARRRSAASSSSTATRTSASPTPAAMSTPSTSIPSTSRMPPPSNTLARGAESARSVYSAATGARKAATGARSGRAIGCGHQRSSHSPNSPFNPGMT